MGLDEPEVASAFLEGLGSMTWVRTVYRAPCDTAKNVVDKVIYRIPAERWIRWQWRERYGDELKLDAPETYNERLHWLKVYGEQRPGVFGDVDLARQCVDKAGVR